MNCEKTRKLISCLNILCEKKRQFLERVIAPILLLALRILIGLVFLKSGLTKIADMNVAIFLFENEYKVPLLSPVHAAYMATFLELTCAVLLFIGLATRLVTFPLIAITLIIQTYVYQNQMHYYWLAILATILTFGPGCISLDALVKKWAKKCNHQLI